MLAAINAGCDAIYAGTDRFSARAYADNLTCEDYIRGMIRAHLCGVKVYLTLNTLLFESEVSDAIRVIRQLYESGLDGIIIQDTGLIAPIKTYFPNLSIHASTQMAVMNRAGAEALKNLGFERIVPARELSLDELISIKKQTGVELECFIHGAMCYSYSGMCLASSMIGDRSGNRGRCAGTCRLPFGGDKYPLSMKDLCGIELLPKLLDAGIDSFKIEGRMKSPEYVAGVTDIYRRAIDAYLENGQVKDASLSGNNSHSIANDSRLYQCDPQDMQILKSLYIRTGISRGYLEGASGRELITFDQPGYSGSDEKVIKDINSRFVHEIPAMGVNLDASIKYGQEISVTYSYECISDSVYPGHTVSDLILPDEKISVTVTAQAPEHAKNAPADFENVKERLTQFGDTPFYLNNCDIVMDPDLFIPVKTLKDLRRRGIEALTEDIIRKKTGVDISGRIASNDEVKTYDAFEAEDSGHTHGAKNFQKYDISVNDLKQLNQVIGFSSHIDRIIVDYDLLINADEELEAKLSDIDPEIIMSLPIVFREKMNSYFEKIIEFLQSDRASYISGVLIHSLDELYLVRDRLPEVKIITGTHVYVCNSQAASFISGQGNVDTVFMSYESSLNDIRDMCKVSAGSSQKPDYEAVVYGRIPMMVSAGCIKKTYGKCDHVRSNDEPFKLTDRKNKTFPVFTDCNICTNIMYNSVSLSLHNMTNSLFKAGINRACINLTIENDKETEIILKAFLTGDEAAFKQLDSMERTTGHIKRRTL